MKHLKKLGSVLLALVMVMALAAPAFADDNEGGEPESPTTATIKVEKHKFSVYQIFVGTYKVGTDTLDMGQDISWGDAYGSKSNRQALCNELAAVLKDTRFSTLAAGDKNPVAKDVVELLDELGAGSGEENWKKEVNISIANALYKFADKSNATERTINPDDSEKTFTPGYYLLHDEEAAANAPIPNIVRNLTAGEKLTVKPKEETNPKLEKEVQTVGNTWQHAAIYHAGDKVPYRITATIPDNFDTTEQGTDYFIRFRDTQDKALEPITKEKLTIKIYGAGTTDFENASPKVTIDNVQPNDARFSFQQLPDTGDEDHVFEITLDNMKSNDPNSPYSNKDLKAGDVIVISYEVELLKDEIGDDGSFKNTVNMSFTNDNGQGPSDDSDTVFTFKLVANKVDGEDKNADGTFEPLTGATFSLYVQDTENGKEITDKDGNKINNEKWTKVDTLGDSEKISEFKFNGLKAGLYMLIEDKAPEGGYNPIKPKYYKIEASYTDNDDLNQSVKDLKVFECDVDGKKIADTTDVIGNNQTITLEIKNFTGAVLPETGGIGTTIFYIVGGVLVVGAVVLLITKRRTSVDDE